MKELTDFLEYNTFVPSGRMPDGPKLDRYRSILPSYLLDLWSASGFCSFQDGLLWVTDPDEHIEINQIFFKGPGTPYCVFRTAFGGMVVMQDGQYFYNDPIILDDIVDLDLDSQSLSFYMNYTLCNEASSKSIFYAHLYKKAKKRLGPPAYDECYAFVPALSAGGEPKVENLKKAKMTEYLYFLSQLRS